MPTQSVVASNSSSSAANQSNLGSKASLQSSGHFLNGAQRPMKTNLLVSASRLLSTRHPLSSRVIQSFETSSSVTSRGNIVDKKSQRCLAVQSMDYNSQQEVSFEGTVGGAAFPEVQQHIYVESPRGSHPFEDVDIGDCWREIQGERNWEEPMLDPLDHRLRSELIRYGEFAQASYDAFDYDELSKFCGCCKFMKVDFFEKVGLKNRGYEIVEYLYSTSNLQLPRFFKTSKVPEDQKWSKSSNWAGFVAVCSSPEEIKRLGRRDIVVAWRGTVTELEWIEDLQSSLCPTGPDPWAGKKSSTNGSAGLKVEKGFQSLYESRNTESTHNKASARDQVLRSVKKLVALYDGEQSITVTGHSMGGALATLCAYDIAESGLNVVHRASALTTTGAPPTIPARVPITAFTFAAPRVGNTAFSDRLAALHVRVLRVVNVHDFVPYVPGLLCHARLKFASAIVPALRNSLLSQLVLRALDSIPATFSNVGVELQVDNLQSPFLKPTRAPAAAHNLELYLHLLAGRGRAGAFSVPLCTRDLALVNKAASLLRREHNIPACWFQEENKGFVRVAGRFTYRPLLHEDFPEPPLDEDALDLELP